MNEIKNEVKNVYILLVYLAGICVFSVAMIMMVTGANSAKKEYNEEAKRIENIRENGNRTSEGYVISCEKQSRQKGGGYNYYKTYGFKDNSGNEIIVSGEDSGTYREVGEQVFISYNPENPEDVIVSGDRFMHLKCYQADFLASVFYSLLLLGVLAMLLLGFTQVVKSEYKKIRETGLHLSEYINLPVFLLIVFCMLCILAAGNFIRAMILYY